MIERSWIGGRLDELDVEDDAEHGSALLDLEQVLELLLELLRAVLVLDGDELERDLVGGVLAARDPLDQFHEVPGLVEHAHVGVDDRDLRGAAQVRDEQRVERDAALVLLVLPVSLEQLGLRLRLCSLVSAGRARSTLRHR